MKAAGDAIRLPLAPPRGMAIPRPNVYRETGRKRIREQGFMPIFAIDIWLSGVGTVDNHVFFGKVAAPSGGTTIRKI